MPKRDAYKLLAECYEQITEKEEAQLIPLTEDEVTYLNQLDFIYYVKDKAALKESPEKNITIKHYNHGFYEVLAIEKNGPTEVYNYSNFEDLLESLLK